MRELAEVAEDCRNLLDDIGRIHAQVLHAEAPDGRIHVHLCHLVEQDRESVLRAHVESREDLSQPVVEALERAGAADAQQLGHTIFGVA